MQDQMTHYMKLLATNQPWRLVLFKKDERWGKDSRIRRLNKTVGISLGFYFLGVFIYLFKTAVIPLTMGGGWRGVGDVIAVGFYLLGVVPLFGIALLEIGLLARGWVEDKKIRLHAARAPASISLTGRKLTRPGVAPILGKHYRHYWIT